MASYQEIGDIVRSGSEEQKREFSRACSAYNGLQGSVMKTMRTLSVKCGWKGQGSLDFSHFHRFHADECPDGIHFRDGEKDICVFSVDESGRAVVSGAWFPDGVSTSEASRMVHDYCLQEDNVAEAVKFSKKGTVVMPVLDFLNGRAYVKSPGRDEDRISEAMERAGIRAVMLGRREFADMYNRYFRPEAGFHKDVVRPVCSSVGFDGVRAYGFADLSVRLSDGKNPDRAYEEGIAYLSVMRDLSDFVVHVRDRLETLAGLPAGHDEMYAFAKAQYPVLVNKGVSIVTNGGAETVGTFTIGEGGIRYTSGLDDTPVFYSDFSSVQSCIESKCLNKENIAMARGEFIAHSLVLPSPQESEAAVREKEPKAGLHKQ